MESYSRDTLKALFIARLKHDLQTSIQPFVDDIIRDVLAHAEAGNTELEYDNHLLMACAQKFTGQVTIEQFLEEIKKMLEAKFPDSKIETDPATGKIKIDWD